MLSVAVNDGRPEEEHLAVVQPGDQPDAAGAGRADSRRDGLRQARVLYVRARGLLRQLRWVYADFFLVLSAEFYCWLFVYAFSFRIASRDIDASRDFLVGHHYYPHSYSSYSVCLFAATCKQNRSAARD